MSDPSQPRPNLYTPEQRWRRDHSMWTLVQGILAPLQFLVFLVSLVLVGRTLLWGLDPEWALWSVVAKTGVLYLIMITGSIWEKAVFGQYLFATSFFWEDVVSMGVMALHTAYVLAWWNEGLSHTQLLWLALAAYNWGPGHLRRLLEKHRARTFEAIAARLPAETQLYVPKVDAVLRRRERTSLAQLAPPSLERCHW